MDTSFLVGNAPTPLLNPLDIQARKIAIQNALAAGALQQQQLQSGGLAFQQQQRAYDDETATRAAIRNYYAGGAPAGAPDSSAAPTMAPAAGLPLGPDGSPLPAAPAYAPAGGAAPAPGPAPAAGGAPAAVAPPSMPSMGDLIRAGVPPTSASALLQSFQKIDENAANIAKLHSDAAGAVQEQIANLANAAVTANMNPTIVSGLLQHFASMGPQYAQMAGSVAQHLNGLSPADQLAYVKSLAASSPQMVTANAKATDANNNTLKTASDLADKAAADLAGRLGASKSQADWIATIQSADPKAVARLNPPAAWSPAAAQTMLAKGSTPAEQATAAQTKSFQDAELGIRRAELGNEQARTNLEVQRFQRQYGAAFGQLPPADQAIAQKVANGDFNPTQLSRMPNKEAILAGAIELNPSWSQQTYQTKHAFEDPNSKESLNLQTISRIVGHIGRFEQNSASMGWSPVYGWAGVKLGGTASSLDEDSHAIAGELEKLVSGGVGAQTEIDAWKNDLRSSLASTRQKAVDEISQLVGSQYEGMAQAYRAGTGLELPVAKYLTPAAQQWMKAKGISVVTSPTAPGAPAPAATPAAAPKQDLSKVPTADLLKALGQ